MDRTVVVGAGVGGLCAAARLARAGCQVTVVERLRHVGGRWSTRNVDGFKLPTGAFLIAMDDPLAETFATLGIDFPVRAIAERTVYLVDGELVGTGDRGGLRALLGTAASHDGSDGDALLQAVRSGLAASPDDGDAPLPDWLRARAAGRSVVAAMHALVQAFMGVNATEVNAQTFFEYLRVTAGRGRHGIPPAGSLSLAENLADYVRAAGGEVIVGASVGTIDVDRGRACGVTLRDGTTIDADVVISDVGPNVTGRLLGATGAPAEPFPTPAPGITCFVATPEPLLDHPVVVVSGTRAVCLLTTPTLVAPELAPPGWHFTESISTFRSSYDASTPRAELDAHLADLDDIVPAWRDGKMLQTATYRHDWPVYRALPGQDVSDRFPLPGLALVGDAVKPAGWPGTGASAEGARIVVDALLAGSAP